MSGLRIAAFSVHTSPLAQPGSGDGGGMNVYISSLAGALASAGVGYDIFTRRIAHEPDVIDVAHGVRVIHLDAGPKGPIAKNSLPRLFDELTDAADLWITTSGVEYQVLHAHYWVSGVIAHRLKHRLDLPLVTTFHTLGLVKAAAGIHDDATERVAAERGVIACSDLILASTPDERRDLVEHYDADPQRVEIVAPGVDHRVFRPCDDAPNRPCERAADRARLGIAPAAKCVLFAGRIQPLKGADIAVEAVASLGAADVELVIVGDPSGSDGLSERRKLEALVASPGLGARVRFVGAVAHDDLAAYYRAADVCIVPSRTESFGLVALEAASCGTPVVASAVGGLRGIVDDGTTGLLIESRDPFEYGAALAKLLGDPALAATMGAQAVARSRRFSWDMTAARLRRLYGDLAVREPVQCR